MTPIRATDELVVAFSPAEVWRVLADVGGYPRWYPRSLRLRVLRNVAGLVGTEFELRPFGGRAFRCRIDGVEAPRSIRLQYYGGFLDGRGEWRLESSASGTRVTYALDVTALGRLAAVIGRVLPFGRIHSRQMMGVLRQLERTLEDVKGRRDPSAAGPR